ncbi:oxygen-independent coproporphyrinogen III oxidase [Tateyamaria omphalii]|uniref:oxygen-independent coproporphyrinogen III oxidase n=1 Tax=Tateyamaria omphalii TaxID=299262 RepID=UPI001C98FECD|nr:oxygen-independent coproporphyrinogen III oxidase [Tateyamaria omphalii]MBY5934144.1 oxygen-independent coproporphyrinogen III oxidase [Tateyamaria omphalii]
MKHVSELRRHGLFDARVPRFTSYPPANWFSEKVDAECVHTWQSTAPKDAKISLYVHIPFCRRLCWFCACRTQGTRSEAPLAPYVERVLTEARQMRNGFSNGVQTRRLHLGGGTPTILPAPVLDHLLTGLHDIWDFSALDEFSVEVDPTDVGPKRLAMLKQHGLSRASLGIQDFDPQVQQAIGREQSRDLTASVVDQLRALNVNALNFDLLYGLPYQTEQTLTATLESALEMEPGRIALFGYAHVPWMSKRQSLIPSDALPAPEKRLALFDLARRTLLGSGYVQIGIDHFARPDDALAQAFFNKRLTRSFQGYTDDTAPYLVGLGASAISTYPQGFAQNIPVTGKYAAQVEANEPALWRGYVLTESDHLRADIVEQLMCYHAATLSLSQRADQTILSNIQHIVDRFGDAVSWDGKTLTITRWAHPLVRMIAGTFATEQTAQTDKRTYSAAI